MKLVAGWKRVTPWTAHAVIAAVLFSFGAAFIGFVTVVLLVFDVSWDANPVVVVPVLYGFFGFWLTMTWRMMRTGLYTCQTGVRIYGPVQSRTVPWSEIADVDVAPALLGDIQTIREAIWLTLVDGERIETPVQCRTGWFEFGWQKNVGPLLRADRFDALVEDLRRHLPAS